MVEKDKEWYLKSHSKFVKEVVVDFPKNDSREWETEITLSVIATNMLVGVTVNGEKYLYTIRYSDAGTPYTQKMEGLINIRGFLSNTSIDWSAIPSNTLFPIISFNGVVNEKKNTMELKLFAPK